MSLKDDMLDDIRTVFHDTDGFAERAQFRGADVVIYPQEMYDVDGEPVPQSSRIYFLAHPDDFTELQRGEEIETMGRVYRIASSTLRDGGLWVEATI